MKRLMAFLAVVVVGIALLAFWPSKALPQGAPAVSQETETASPRLLVHLLDYLAVDYGGAVQNGKVVSDAEYNEQLEFIQTAVKLSRELQELQSAPEVHQQIAELDLLIHSKADAAHVANKAREAQAKVIDLVRLPAAPAVWPSLASADSIFKETCSKCHGPEGRGDGPAAANLATKPANFQDPVKMREMTPFQAFNTIRLGVPKTPMAAFTSYSDRDIWNLAFYVIALRYRAQGPAPMDEKTLQDLGRKLDLSPDDVLRATATSSDNELERQLRLEATGLASLRLYSPATSPLVSLDLARVRLEQVRSYYAKRQFDMASQAALSAYVDGVEPVEPRLRANDPGGLATLEQQMGVVRAAIHDRQPDIDVAQAITKAEGLLSQASDLLTERKSSPALAFTLALGILVREGFEAALIIVALLGVLRVSGVKKATRWVHGGWIVAVAAGVVAWSFSGWLTQWSGFQRELVEAITGIVTVGILLYLGFWLHRKTEIGKWKNFIESQVQMALSQKNLYRLALIAFLAAFREAIESVLFLRAIWLEGGAYNQPALAAGVATAFVVVLVLGWLLLKFSARVPVRTLFSISAIVMVGLAVILTGKAVHAFQEVDILWVSLSPIALRSDWFGIYPTRETLIAQLCVLGFSVFLWMYGKAPQGDRPGSMRNS